MNSRAWGLFSVVSVLWGIPYLLIGIAPLDEGFGPLAVAAGRVLVAAGVLAPIALSLQVRTLLSERFLRVAALAMVEVVVPFGAIAAGEQTVSSSVSGVLVATEPIFVLLLGAAAAAAGTGTRTVRDCRPSLARPPVSRGSS